MMYWETNDYADVTSSKNNAHRQERMLELKMLISIMPQKEEKNHIITSAQT